MAKRQNDDVRRWAALGAEQRLTQIQEEEAAILRAFPELRRGRRVRGAATASTEIGDGARRTPARKGGRPGRRNLSPEARKRISDAQKARWAKFHAKAASTGSSPAAAGRKKR